MSSCCVCCRPHIFFFSLPACSTTFLLSPILNRRERWALCTLLGFPYLHTTSSMYAVLCCCSFAKISLVGDKTRPSPNTQQQPSNTPISVWMVLQPRKRESKEILRVGVGLASSFRLISHLIISPYMAKAIIFVWVWRCAGWARNDFPSNTCFPPNLTYDRSSVVSLFYIYLFKKGGEYNITHTSLELIIPPFTLSFVRLLLPYSPFFLFL